MNLHSDLCSMGANHIFRNIYLAYLFWACVPCPDFIFNVLKWFFSYLTDAGGYNDDLT
jgi:hypothetical protein